MFKLLKDNVSPEPVNTTAESKTNKEPADVESSFALNVVAAGTVTPALPITET